MILGITGTFVILVAYLLNLFKVLHKEHFVYLLLNFVGAIVLTFYSFELESMPFIVLNIAWALFTLIDFIKIRLSQ